MVKFEFKGIQIEATAELEQYDFRDSGGNYKTHFNREANVKIRFWDFVILNDLYELAVLKSSLNYFIQAYWKRSSKLGTRIKLATSIEHKDNNFLQSLNLIAKQKNNIYSLEISLTENGNVIKGIYLNAREVIMMDIAISKAISLLMPQTFYLKK
ncbi:MAG: hypothetical protein AB2L12_13990 [Smithellaceae bacterium]|nr:MAG: hypothetical protein BWX92_02971 [Deltaproteobacteria bacterium ADurb.Bin135]